MIFMLKIKVGFDRNDETHYFYGKQKKENFFAKMFGVSKKVVFLHPQIERLNAIKKRGISSVG